MSDITRTHRPTTSSPRYTKARGIGRDRMRWPAHFETYRHLPTPGTARPMLDPDEENHDDG